MRAPSAAIPPPLPLAGGGRLALDRPRVMAILNATPDSFSDGGAVSADPEAAIRRALAEGADVLDVGGESTRPGHAPVPADEELRRVLPVVAAIRRIDARVPVSIDTRKAAVARAALAAGASLVNDVGGLDDPAMAQVVRGAGCAAVVMRHAPLRGDVAEACRAELAGRVRRALEAGVSPDAVVVDPGIGFGDPPGGDVAANLRLIDSIAAWSDGRPVLVGASRKRFIGTMTGVAQASLRVEGSVAVAVRAIQAGAHIVRVHDVGPTVRALESLGLR